MILLENGNIVSGSSDSVIRIWNFKNGVCIYKLKGHLNKINSLLSLQNGFIASGSSDAMIRIWEISTGKCVKILKGH